MKPRVIPSSKEANRLIALATRMPPGFSTPVRLAERRQPLFARGQVVERSHQEHDIGAAGSVRQGAGIADGRSCQRMFRLRRGRRTCLLHMTRHRIDQMHFVAVRGKPARIPAGAAADIQHHLRRRRQKTPDQLLHAGELRHPGPPPKPALFVVALVVREHVTLCRRPTHCSTVLGVDQSREWNGRPEKS